jgi:ubiquinone/menaquinone biosynthesis C-methylase UbiE
MADVYDAGRTLSGATVERWTAAARVHVDASAGPLLDLGAGTGRFSTALARGLGTPVVGLEPAEAMRARARSVAGTAVSLVGGSAESLPFGPARFCGVWASQVLHHVADLGACTRELRRVLVPGGRVLVRGMFGPLEDRWPPAPYFPDAVRIAADRFPPLAEISDRFASAGMVVVAHEHIRQVSAPDPESLVERISLRADSGLALIDDDAFALGLARLRRDVDDGVVSGPVSEVLDLVVYG